MKTILILIFLDALIRNSVVIQSCRQRRGKERRYYKKSDFFFIDCFLFILINTQLERLACTLG